MDSKTSTLGGELLPGLSEKLERLLPEGQKFHNFAFFDKHSLGPLPRRARKHFRDDEFPAIFGEVANSEAPSLLQRQRYFQALVDTYAKMASHLEFGDRTLLVAPEREGAILARRLGWQAKTGAVVFPRAKRIFHEGGVAVGLDDIQVDPALTDALIVDGAVASGSTLMAIIQSLKLSGVSKFALAIVHGTEQSLRILDNFALENAINLKIHIAFVSGRLNEKYYAVHPDGKLVVGDLGDTISDLGEVGS